jgi:O-antigen ligase
LAWTGNGAYPHNNILGMAAENGIISAIFYLGFMTSVIIVGIRIFTRNKTLLNKIESEPIKYFSFMAVACFIFLQFKGLFQDTWQLKEIYFWAGIIVGIADWLQANRFNSGCHQK